MLNTAVMRMGVLKTMNNCTYCAETLPANHAVLCASDGNYPVCDLSCHWGLLIAWDIPQCSDTATFTALECPTVDLIPDSLSMDVSTEELNLGLLQCEKQGIPFSHSLPDSVSSTVFSPLAGQYSPFCPPAVESSLASDVRYCMAVSVSAFVLAIGSVLFFSHLLF